MKRTPIVAVVVAVVAAFAAVAVASQYSRPGPSAEPVDTGTAVLGEQMRSMSDCMTFSASHKSRGTAVDTAEFKRQFGEPTGGAGAVTEYSYDRYTKIILDCSKKACSCRCLQK